VLSLKNLSLNWPFEQNLEKFGKVYSVLLGCHFAANFCPHDNINSYGLICLIFTWKIHHESLKIEATLAFTIHLAVLIDFNNLNWLNSNNRWCSR